MARENVVFEERKRIKFFGLPWTFTKYFISDNNIIICTGFLNKEENDCYMYKVQDVTLNTSLMQRIFNIGTITCHTGDVTHKVLVLENVKNPRRIKDYIIKASEEARLKRRTVNTLDIGADDDGTGEDFDE